MQNETKVPSNFIEIKCIYENVNSLLESKYENCYFNVQPIKSMATETWRKGIHKKWNEIKCLLIVSIFFALFQIVRRTFNNINAFLLSPLLLHKSSLIHIRNENLMLYYSDKRIIFIYLFFSLLKIIHLIHHSQFLHLKTKQNKYILFLSFTQMTTQ